jgi:predicted NAD/FAD-dependent oxidoreductase
LLHVREPEDVHVHRWTFARPTGRREQPYALVDGDRPVGVCGDGWGEAPKVETAWLSGVRLGRALAERLT